MPLKETLNKVIHHVLEQKEGSSIGEVLSTNNVKPNSKWFKSRELNGSCNWNSREKEAFRVSLT